MQARVIDTATRALDLPERIDAVNAGAFEATVQALIQEGVSGLVFNFKQTSYMSSAGLRVLFKTTKLLQPVHGRMVLCEVGEAVQSILDLSGFAQVLTLCETEAEALETVKG